MASGVDDIVDEFLQYDRIRSSKTMPFIQEETDVSTPAVAEFFSNQSVLITGVTGFLGKLLLEKLLRSCPEINTVYVLIRANKKTGQDAASRLKKLLASPVFSQTSQGLLDKVVAVAADVAAPGLGLSPAHCQTLRDNVSVVFHVAASLNFSSPLPNALNTNVLGTRRIINLCQLMKNIKALVYVSTAYCNCTQRSVVVEQIYPTTHNTDDLAASLAKLSPSEVAELTPTILSGHPNTYSFTKLQAENLILKERGAVPVAIIRPSIVLGTMREPVQGWVDNVNNGAFAFIAGAGKGVFRTILADGKKVADMVPCDLVVNLMIAAAPHIAFSDCGVKVFHMTSGSRNPLRWREYAAYTVAGVRRSPCLAPVWYPGARCRSNIPWTAFKLAVSQYIPALLLYAYGKLKGREHILVGIQNKYVRGMLLSKYFTVNEWKFDTTNTEALASSLSKADQTTFNFDVTQIPWPEYLEKCALGVKRFFHKEGPNVDHVATRHLIRSWWIDTAAKVVVFLLTFLFWGSLLGTNLLSLAIALIVTFVLFFL